MSDTYRNERKRIMNTEPIATPDQKKKKKKKMLIAIIVVSLLAAVSYILLENPQIFEKQEKQTITSMYSDKLYSYVFYPADYERDITQDAEYMDLDRSVHYKLGYESVLVPREEAGDYNEAVQFFYDYFDVIMAGDVETYNTFFTDRYYEYYDPYVTFTPQMIYNIEVEQLSETLNDDGTVMWKFNVTYMIHKNDGTFRNDIESNASKTLYYELICDNDGNVLIDYITYYRR